MKIALAFALGLAIGAGCRFFDVPVPSPPNLLGALLVLSITVGYAGTDRLLTHFSRGAFDRTAARGAPE